MSYQQQQQQRQGGGGGGDYYSQNRYNNNSNSNGNSGNGGGGTGNNSSPSGGSRHHSGYQSSSRTRDGYQQSHSNNNYSSNRGEDGRGYDQRSRYQGSSSSANPPQHHSGSGQSSYHHSHHQQQPRHNPQSSSQHNNSYSDRRENNGSSNQFDRPRPSGTAPRQQQQSYSGRDYDKYSGSRGPNNATYQGGSSSRGDRYDSGPTGQHDNNSGGYRQSGSYGSGSGNQGGSGSASRRYDSRRDYNRGSSPQQLAAGQGSSDHRNQSPTGRSGGGYSSRQGSTRQRSRSRSKSPHHSTAQHHATYERREHHRGYPAQSTLTSSEHDHQHRQQRQDTTTTSNYRGNSGYGGQSQNHHPQQEQQTQSRQQPQQPYRSGNQQRSPIESRAGAAPLENREHRPMPMATDLRMHNSNINNQRSSGLGQDFQHQRQPSQPRDQHQSQNQMLVEQPSAAALQQLGQQPDISQTPPPPQNLQRPQQTSQQTIAATLVSKYGTLVCTQSKGDYETWRSTMSKIAGVGIDARSFTYPEFQRVQTEFKTNFKSEVLGLKQKYNQFAEHALKEYKQSGEQEQAAELDSEEQTKKCLSLLPVNFNTLVVNPEAVLAKKNQGKPQAPSKSSDILAKLKQIQAEKSRLLLRDQNLELKKNILMAQVHLKNIKIDQPSPSIVEQSLGLQQQSCDTQMQVDATV